MQWKCYFSRRASIIMLWLFLGCYSFAPAQTAQTWIEVMINGPWHYVPDASAPAGHPRIILIAPASDGHLNPMIFPGPNASTPPAASPQLWPAAYTLLIEKVVEQPNCGNHPPSDLPLYYPATIPAKNIHNALSGTVIDPDTQQTIPVYSITLPAPCYVTSIAESRSKMDAIQISNQSEKSYATWTSLHYLVASRSPSATINGVPVSFASDLSYPTPSFSILMPSANMTNDNQCDHVSLKSVDMSRKLLGLNGGLFAEFPILLGSGSASYQTHTYSTDPKCLLPIKLGTLWMTSAGSGDCHMAQMNINNALK